MKQRLKDNSVLEERLEYTFRRPELLENALTHSSYASEKDKSYRYNNERLEFIGDAFLDAIIGLRLYELRPDDREGVLSKTRANIVCERSLAGISRELGIGQFLLLGNGEDASGGRDKDSILADALEAVIGAILLDSSYEEASRVVLSLFYQTIRLAIQGRLFHDYKTELQERLQEQYRLIRIEYTLVEETGPDHDKVFTVEVSARGRTMGRGSGKSKKEAEQAAARDVLLKGEL
ncbi:MAG: ribonuclease III [Mogibacterium sp.]|nr:ribonuclease III [Mogibacterium sp.]